MREPWAYKFALDQGVSHLGVMAHVSDWYRDAELIERFETFAADGFFEGYERVIFAGVSMGAYAAIAFASLVPGAHVVAINPQTTLDEALVPWETRYENGRRQNWALPLGDAAALTGSLGRVNVFYDPYHALDQKHVDRLGGENIHIYRCRYSQHKTAVFLRKIGAHKTVMERCIFDELTDAEFYRLYRARRNLPWFRGSVSSYFKDSGREETAKRFDLLFRARLRTRAKEADKQTDAGRDGTDTAEIAHVGSKIRGQPKHDTKIVAPTGGGQTAPAEIPRAEMGSRLIVTTMKNEGPFMLEWVAYNRVIGFTDFLIYTNDCADGTDLIADRLQALGLAQHRENRFRDGKSPQRAALAQAQNEAIYTSADWLMCADCDEFLNIRAGRGRLDDLFAAVGDADAISVCWRLFGNSGHVAFEDALITERFDCCAGEDEYSNFRARGMKTLVRNNELFRKLRVHRPAFNLGRGDVKWVDAGGLPMPSFYLDGGWKTHTGFRHDHARLHHYAVRSVDNFLVKRDRGRTNHIHDDQGEDYWTNMNVNSERDTSIHKYLAPLREELAMLMRDPELARLHADAVIWHRDKISELKERDTWADFREKIARINAATQAETG
ncbi:glycosyltransferase family 2 protein [Roseobacter sp. MH60115]|uniref:glycosyltransferase family 2 protein n=1 Tax=Roseobacter sp. MH60115 TaxID=2785324 RepID=UPI001E31B112|nr:glycosyltransferase family 2 protein [Roseobacter sp. MH60115]